MKAANMRAASPMRRSWLDDSDGGWIAHRLRLVLSPAWKARPKPLCRILERLEVEHMLHGGKENGRLCVSYDQFVREGVSRKVVKAAVEVGQQLGLLVVTQTDEIVRNIRAVNVYRLTYVPEKGRRAPTDEWQSIDAAKAADIVSAFHKLIEDRSGGGQKTDRQFPFRPSSSALSGQNSTASSALSGQSPVPERELSNISGGEPTSATTSSTTPSVEEAAQRATPQRRSKPPLPSTESVNIDLPQPLGSGSSTGPEEISDVEFKFDPSKSRLAGLAWPRPAKSADRKQPRILAEVLDMIRGSELDTEAYLDQLRALPGSEQFTAAKRDLTWKRRQAKAATLVNDGASETLGEAAGRLLATLDAKRVRQ